MLVPLSSMGIPMAGSFVSGSCVDGSRSDVCTVSSSEQLALRSRRYRLFRLESSTSPGLTTGA